MPLSNPQWRNTAEKQSFPMMNMDSMLISPFRLVRNNSDLNCRVMFGITKPFQSNEKETGLEKAGEYIVFYTICHLVPF